jgi:small subunit ribosomal protein S6
MNQYELTLVLEPEEKTSAKTIEKVKGWVVAAKGSVEKNEAWGIKRLAYPISRKTEGSYHNLTFTLEGNAVAAILRRLKMESGILRYLLLRSAK